MTDNKIAEVLFSCGRSYLSVAGIAVAMEGDKCRDSNIPESILPEIEESELASATIGGKPVKDVPIKVTRWFRGDCWTEKMMEYVADKINQAVQDKGPIY